jgi:TolB-like protein/Tfp pilus assembly protein PilF
MPSLIPGFEYDVFISYRQNDNRSGWVTEFVKNLQEELASTIKDPVSVYFDSNPHDGLLETHNVDKSLERKLRCLIFIPILSQTYCDTKSFAWRHEFVAFHKIAKEDQFGRDIQLNNGNVASRILPIKIHDLDAEDKALLENELGGALRAIEFIYKEPGVNRPLKSSDNKNDNQNRTDYKNQVNKVADAIKEILTSIKNPATASPQPLTILRTPTKSIRSKRTLIAVSFLLLLSITGYFLYPALFSSYKEDEVLDKSIAVLPFVNMSNDPDQEYFSDGLSEELLNLLSKIPELKVTGRTSSFSFKGKNEDLRIIGDKLGVAHILEGSVQREGKKIRVTAQLIRAADGIHLWSERYERDVEGIFKLQDDIAGAVVKELKLKLLPRTHNAASGSTSTEVYNLILQGDYYVDKRDKDNVAKALDFYLKALALDSLNARSWAALAHCYAVQSGWGWIDRNHGLEKARKAASKSIALDDTRAEAHLAYGTIKAWDFDWDGAEAEYQKALNLEPGNADVLRFIGFLYRSTGRYEEAIRMTNQSITLDPVQPLFYLFQGQNFYYANHFGDAIASFKKALELNPQLPRTHLLLGEIYLLQGKPEMTLAEMQQETEGVFKDFGMPLAYFALKRRKEADEALNNYVTNYQNDWPYQIARVYAFRGETDKAFEWLEKAYTRKEQRLIWLKGDPLLKNLEGDPRHAAFLKKMNLPE